MNLPLRAAPPRSPQPGRRQHGRGAAVVGGFTIIELLIALVIVGVLAALAYPSFMDAVRKGRRAEAFGKLTAVQLAQERWRSNNASYSAELSNAPDATPPGLGIPGVTSGGRYSIALGANPTATRYSVVASAVAGTSQVDDGNCTQLSVRILEGNIFYGSVTPAGTVDESAGNRCWVR